MATVLIRVLIILSIVATAGVAVHLFTGFPQFIEDASALPLHSLSLTLVNDQGEAKPTKTQAYQVEISGNVTIEKPQGVERVTVSLTMECENGWETALSPQTMVFINPGSQRFQLSIETPGGSNVTTAQFHVYGHASSLIWEDDQSVSGSVKVLQYYKLRIEVKAPLSVPEPGESVKGKLLVFNDGNGDDTLQISVVDTPKEITDWTFGQDGQTIPPSLYGEFSYTLFMIEDLDPGLSGLMLTVVFKVISLGARSIGLSYEKTYPVFIYYEGLESKIIEDWPTYTGYGLAIGGLIALPLLIRRWRRRRRELISPQIPEGGH